MNEEEQLACARAIDDQVAHVWMVRSFLKHAEESEEDQDLRGIVRDLYDFILAVGAHDDMTDPEAYLKTANKKWRRLKGAAELYQQIQPEVSSHTNFAMAARSLSQAVNSIERLLGQVSA